MTKMITTFKVFVTHRKEPFQNVVMTFPNREALSAFLGAIAQAPEITRVIFEEVSEAVE